MTIQVAADPYPFPLAGGLATRDSAVVVIDMQLDFCGVGGYMDAMGYDVAHLRAPIEPIRRVLAAARAAGLHILHTRQGYRADLADLPEHKRLRSQRAGAGVGEPGPMGRFLVRGEPGWEIVPELAPESGEPVVDKTSSGAFYATDFEPILMRRGVRNLVFAGITTDVCVHSTLRQANDRGYQCLLLADCCASGEPAIHEAAVRMVKFEGGVLGTVADSRAFIDAVSRL